LVSFFGVEGIFIKFAFLLDRISVIDNFLDEISVDGNVTERSTHKVKVTPSDLF